MLVKCKTCGEKVAKDAHTCVHCGEKKPGVLISFWDVIGIIFLGFVLITILDMLFGS